LFNRNHQTRPHNVVFYELTRVYCFNSLSIEFNEMLEHTHEGFTRSEN